MVICLFWRCAGELVLVCVPRTSTYGKVDLDRLARAVQKPKEQIQMCKLKEVQKLTNFPLFVALPFGVPVEKGKPPAPVLADSQLLDLRPGTDLFFDCGTVGIRMRPEEFTRAVRPSYVELCEEAAPAPPGSSPQTGAGPAAS